MKALLTEAAIFGRGGCAQIAALCLSAYLARSRRCPYQRARSCTHFKPKSQWENT
jgi:hypothetical protein